MARPGVNTTNVLRVGLTVVTAFAVTTVKADEGRSGPTQAAEQAPVAALPVVNIGVVFDGPWVRKDEIAALFQQEIRALSERDFDIRFPRIVPGDWTIEAVQRNLSSLLADPGIDLVLTMGILVSNEAIQRRDLPKPMIAPFVINRSRARRRCETRTTG